jgi:hypothetical protein
MLGIHDVVLTGRDINNGYVTLHPETVPVSLQSRYVTQACWVTFDTVYAHCRRCKP